MKDKVKLPIGIENFEKIRTEGFYYVDKTGLIRELLDNWGEVNLFARPRRFGKSLNMKCLRLEGSNFRLGGIAPITRAVPSFRVPMRLAVSVVWQKGN